MNEETVEPSQSTRPRPLSHPVRFDMSNGEEALARAADHFNAQIVEGERAYGFHKKSTGAPVHAADGSKRWLRVTGTIGSPQTDVHIAELEANRLTRIPKPKILDCWQWTDGDVCWRAVLMTRARSPSNITPWRTSGAPLTKDWYQRLGRTLLEMTSANSGSNILTRRQVALLIEEQFGDDAPRAAPRWQVTHGDLNWSNLTAPNFTLLDWERWGWAPEGYAAGRLLAFSLLDPDVVTHLRRVFARHFDSPSGLVGMLAAAAEVKTQIDAGSYPAELMEPLEKFAEAIVQRHGAVSRRVLGRCRSFWAGA